MLDRFRHWLFRRGLKRCIYRGCNKRAEFHEWHDGEHYYCEEHF